jgi:hypothetical protein
MKILTNDEIKHALTTCKTENGFAYNCPLKDTNYCMTILVMNALMSGDRDFILRGIDIYEDYYGQSAFLTDVKTLLTEDNNG